MWHAAALALYTGQRQGDVLAMTRAKIKNGLIEVKQEKTGRELVIPAHQKLLAVLATMKGRVRSSEPGRRAEQAQTKSAGGETPGYGSDQSQAEQASRFGETAERH